jgi:hypothetical protein
LKARVDSFVVELQAVAPIAVGGGGSFEELADIQYGARKSLAATRSKTHFLMEPPWLIWLCRDNRECCATFVAKCDAEAAAKGENALHRVSLLFASREIVGSLREDMLAYSTGAPASPALTAAFFKYIEMVSLDGSSAETPHRDTTRATNIASASKTVWWSVQNRRRQTLRLVQNFVRKHDARLFEQAWSKCKGVVVPRMPRSDALVVVNRTKKAEVLKRVYCQYPYNKP